MDRDERVFRSVLVSLIVVLSLIASFFVIYKSGVADGEQTCLKPEIVGFGGYGEVVGWVDGQPNWVFEGGLTPGSVIRVVYTFPSRP